MSWQPSSRREKDNHKVGGVSAVLDAADEAWSPTVTVLSDTTQRYAHATGLLSMYNLGPQLSIAAARVALLVRRVVREADKFQQRRVRLARDLALTRTRQDHLYRTRGSRTSNHAAARAGACSRFGAVVALPRRLLHSGLRIPGPGTRNPAPLNRTRPSYARSHRWGASRGPRPGPRLPRRPLHVPPRPPAAASDSPRLDLGTSLSRRNLPSCATSGRASPL